MFRIIVAIVIMLGSFKAHSASCCGSSSSSTAEGHSSLNQNTFLFLTGADYNKNTKFIYNGKRVSFGVAYGITDRFAVSVKSSYAWLNTTTYRPGRFDTLAGIIDTIKTDTTFDFSNNGIDDGSLCAQVLLMPFSPITQQEVKAGASVELPWGIWDKSTILEGNAVLLPPKTQNGSGSFGVGAFINYSHIFPDYLIGAATSLSGSLRFKGKNGDTRGKELNASATAIVGPFEKFKGMLTVAYGITEKTLSKNGSYDSTTGGQRINLTTGIDLSIFERAQFVLNTTIPVWQDLNQKLIGNSLSVKLSATIFLPGIYKEVE